MVGVTSPLFGGQNFQGASQWTDTYYDQGDGQVAFSDSNTGVFPATDNPNAWSNTYTWMVSEDEGGGCGGSGPADEPLPPFGPGGSYVPSSSPSYVPDFSPTIFSQSTTRKDIEYTFDYVGIIDDYSDVTTLSNEYTSQQFQSDVFVALQNPSTYYGGYSAGDTLAWRELAYDSSSFSVGTASYKFTCASTGSNPYEYEWYEVFQPDDDTQPIQVTHQEWDNANTASESPVFTLDPSTQTTNGVWYIARLDSQTLAQYPECQWRHVIGVGENVTFNLIGLPASISGSATWSITPSTSGTFNSASLIGASKSFTAERTPGNVTITATLPGGATMSTTLSILAPTGVTYTKIAPFPTSFGYVGAGIWGQYTFQPTNVSFSGLNWQEEKCPATGGYGFYQYLHLWHDPNGVGTPFEPPDTNTNWVAGIQDDNTADDLDKTEIFINAYEGAFFYMFFGAGSGFSWDIPIRYRCKSDTDNGVELSSPVPSSMDINFYNCTIIKGDAQDTQP